TKNPLWTLGFRLGYPPGGPDFESFESWLVNNEIRLQKKVGTGTVPPNGGFEIDDQTGRRAVARYRFLEEGDVKLRKPEDWKVIYKTPGAMVTVPVPFEFKDLPLP